MSPQKQAAQIANAQKSRGPATEAGRARSSQNSIRHSLCSKKYFITPEERPEFDLYYNDLLAALAPEGALESKVVEAIIMDEWRLTRARQVENQIFCRGYMSAKSEDQFISGAETWLAHSRELATLTLYEQRINRVLARNKAEFASLQAARQASGAGRLPYVLSITPSQEPEALAAVAEAAESKSETDAPEQSAGFVHSSDVPTPSPDPQPLTPAAKGTATASPEVARWLRSFESDIPAPIPAQQPLAPGHEPARAPARNGPPRCLICQNPPPPPPGPAFTRPECAGRSPEPSNGAPCPC